MKKLLIFLVITGALIAAFWFFVPFAGRWDARDIEAHLSVAPYTNPKIESQSTVEERLGIQWTVHRGTVEYEGEGGQVAIAQNQAAGLAILAYQGTQYQGLRVVSSGLMTCATHDDFLPLLELYFAQSIGGFGGIEFATSPFEVQRIVDFKTVLDDVDAQDFNPPCDTVVREMKREAAQTITL